MRDLILFWLLALALTGTHKCHSMRAAFPTVTYSPSTWKPGQDSHLKACQIPPDKEKIAAIKELLAKAQQEKDEQCASLALVELSKVPKLK